MNTQTTNAAGVMGNPSETSRTKFGLLLGLSLGYFMVLLDTTVVTVALPDISKSLGASLSELQWVSNGYVLTFAALLLTAGALSDKFGGKRIFTLGLWAFCIISGTSALSPNIETLIAMRAILGIAGALLLPTSLALIAHGYSDPAQRAKALGGWAAITGVALASGPIVGGVLTDLVGWRAIFMINVPVAIVSIVLTRIHATETPRQVERRVDIGGLVTSIIGLSCLTFALIESTRRGWNDLAIIVSLGIAVVSFAAFVILQNGETRKPGSRMLPLRLFKIPTFSAGVFAGLLVNFALTGLLFVFSLFFQESRNYSAFDTGMVFLPLTLPTAFNPIFTGRLVAKIGPKLPAVLGFSLMALGALIEIPFISNSQTSLIMNCIGLAIFGFGVSFAIPSLITAVVTTVPKELTGIGSGALNSSRQTGALLGVAVLGSIITLSEQSVSSTQSALAVICGVLVLGACVVAYAVGRKTPHAK